MKKSNTMGNLLWMWNVTVSIIASFYNDIVKVYEYYKEV